MKKILLLLGAIFLLGIPCKAWEVWCSSTLSKVYVYTWNSSSYIGDEWPGTPMTKVGDNLWYYKGEGNPTGIIFNEGSNSNQTADLSFKDGGIYGFNNSDLTSIEIPNSVTSIEDNAFRYCSGLTSVTIPNSVTSIGDWAFYGCEGLKKSTYPSTISDPFDHGISIRYPAGDSVIEEGIVYGKNRSTIYFVPLDIEGEFIIPNSVTSIGSSAFRYCSGLTSVTIPNSVTSIGDWAFYGCEGLKKSTYPSTISNPFNYGISIRYPAEDSVIEEGIVYGKNRSTIYFCPLDIEGEFIIPNSVTSIGSSAFEDCSCLTSVTIPNYVTSIGESAFRDCSGLTSMTIPNYVISIGSSAFNGCRGLTNIVFNAEDCTICGSSSFPAFPSNITDLKIGNQVKRIPSYAFYNCNILTKVTIPNSVTSIGESAFCNCKGLTSVTIPNSVTSIGDYAFNGCTGIKNLKFEDGENIIELGCNYFVGSGNEGKGLFYDCPLETLYLGRTLSYYSDKKYGYSPFYNNKTLNELTISNSVTSIGESAFEECSGLTSVTIPNSVSSIGSSAFEDCSGLTSVTIPNSVTSIGSYAFQGCSGLTSVTIPNSVTSIGSYAFRYCSGLTSVTIGNSVTSIGSYAFYNCSGLTTVTIGNSVTSIGESAFRYCSGLSSVTIPNSVTSIGSYAFRDCSGLKSVTIGNSVTSIGSSAFEDCSGLKSVTIGNSVTSIGSYAFQGCSGLTSVTIPNSVNSIGNWAFDGCSLTKIKLEQQTPPPFYEPFNNFKEEATLIIPDNTLVDYLHTDWKNFRIIEEANGLPAYIENDGVFKYRFIESLSEAWLLQDNNYKSMTSVSIPDRVVGELNGSDAFYKVTAIEPAAFKDCSNITQLKLPANLVEIGSEAFYNCNKIPSVVIPASVIEIGDEAFLGCTGLKRVDIADLESWCKIEFKSATSNPLYYAHDLYVSDDLLTELIFPSNLSEIKNYSFQKCTGLKELTIGNSVKSIGVNAFSDCSGLSSLIIPNSVTFIGESAFSDCSGLSSLSVPASVLTIGNNAFENIEFDSFKMEDGIDSLTWEGKNNISVKNLYVGRNTENKVSYSSIENLQIGGYIEKIEANLYNNSTLTSVIINPGSGIVIEDGAFKGCKRLTEITLPEDIAEIGANAFSGTGLKNITIPNGSICANAFANCNLDNIIIGAGVESIGEKAFDGNNAIKAVYATPTTPPAAENNTFSYYEAQLYVPEEAIDTYYNNTRCWYRFSGKPLVMPENIVLEGPADITGEPGETFQLTATILPSNVTLDRVLWRSTNPAVATVDNNGLVTIHNFPNDVRFRAAGSNGYCEIIASTLYEDSPVAVVRIEALDAAIEYVNADGLNSGWLNGAAPNDIYTLQGVCLKRNASQSDIDALAPGMYIIGGKKVIVKN